MALGRQTSAPGTRSGKKRHRTDPAVARTSRRRADSRVRGALDQAAQDRAWLEREDAEVRRIVAEWTAELQAKRAAALAAHQPPPPVPALHDLTNRSAGDRTRWNVGQARLLLEDGYSLEHVCRKTGWGGWWFRDAVDNDGYVRPQRAAKRWDVA